MRSVVPSSLSYYYGGTADQIGFNMITSASGDYFADKNPPQGAKITKLLIRHGDVVDAIQAYYGTTAMPLHGGTGGVATTINLAADEYIVALTGVSADYFGARHIVTMYVVTNKNKYGPFGNGNYSTNHMNFHMGTPPGQRIAAFNGRTARHTNGDVFLAAIGVGFVYDANATIDSGVVSSAVTLFQHGSYGGASQNFGPGRYDVGDLKIGNDQVSSVRVQPGYTVTLYADAGFSGATKVFTGDASYVGNDFNDKVSSLVVEGPVTIYQHGSYGGASQSFGPGRYDMAKLTIGNDQASSLKVKPGYKVTLFSDAGFSGTTKVFTSDTTYVGNDFNDKLSSLIVESTAVPAQSAGAITSTASCAAVSTSYCGQAGSVDYSACGAVVAGSSSCGVVAAGIAACGAVAGYYGVCGAVAVGAGVCGTDFQGVSGGLATACGQDVAGISSCGAVVSGTGVCGVVAGVASACAAVISGAGACVADISAVEFCGAEASATEICAADAGFQVQGAGICAANLGFCGAVLCVALPIGGNW